MYDHTYVLPLHRPYQSRQVVSVERIDLPSLDWNKQIQILTGCYIVYSSIVVYSVFSSCLSILSLSWVRIYDLYLQSDIAKLCRAVSVQRFVASQARRRYRSRR